LPQQQASRRRAGWFAAAPNLRKGKKFAKYARRKRTIADGRWVETWRHDVFCKVKRRVNTSDGAASMFKAGGIGRRRATPSDGAPLTFVDLKSKVNSCWFVGCWTSEHVYDYGNHLYPNMYVNYRKSIKNTKTKP
jgi:hypothetical protein